MMKHRNLYEMAQKKLTLQIAVENGFNISLFMHFAHLETVAAKLKEETMHHLAENSILR
jgi:hypothetical protein